MWARSLETPLRRFLRTETGSAAVLLAATLAALAWANIDPSGYAATWHTVLVIRSGTRGVADSWQGWVNSGLMAFFFLVAGLEARREFDMGELRERRRLALPLVVALGGMVVPIAIYLAINAGRSSASGWGAAMSTDTAFALGLLALVGRGVPDRVRTYLLTFALVDDVAGIVIIALAYSGHIDLVALGVGLAILGAVIVVRWRGVRNGAAYLLLGVAAWVAFFESGVDPVVVGLVMGLLALAYPAARRDLEQASESFRLFREQPTPELARDARESVRLAISPNDRLQQLFHPWTSYLIVPLFALANAGITISGSFLARAYTSPVTLGILLGYVVGKPAGTVGSRLAADPGQPRPDPPAGRLGGRHRRRGHRGHRVHRVPADRLARLPRHRASRGEGGRAVRRACAHRPSPGWSSGSPRCCRNGCGCARCSAPPRPSSTWRCPSIPSATTCAARTGHRSRWWSTATSNARTAARPNQWSGSCSPTTVTCVTYGGTCRSPTCTRTRCSPPTAPRPQPGKASSGRCTTSCSDHQGALTAKDLIRYAGQLGLDTERFTADLATHAGRSQNRRGPGLRRPQRRLGHAHLLHQRQTPPRRLRHRHPLRRGPVSQGTGPDRLRPAATAHVLIRSPPQGAERQAAERSHMSLKPKAVRDHWRNPAQRLAHCQFGSSMRSRKQPAMRWITSESPSKSEGLVM